MEKVFSFNDGHRYSRSKNEWEECENPPSTTNDMAAVLIVSRQDCCHRQSYLWTTIYTGTFAELLRLSDNLWENRNHLLLSTEIRVENGDYHLFDGRSIRKAY